MKTILRRAKRVREKKAVYEADTADIIIMEGIRLDEAEECLRSLRAKAVKVSQALKDADIPHAVIGGLAVLAHVARVNKALIRNTRDLDILINRSDLNRTAQALKSFGFSYRKVMGIPAFVLPRKVGSITSRFAEGVHIVWADERVRPTDLIPAPSLLSQSIAFGPDGYACLDIENLLKMKLTSFRLKDQVHIQDLMNVGLITQKVKNSLPPELKARLKEVEEKTKQEKL
ncbi:MAG: hypothetical protein V1899_02190 [Planctomycetota bacterium]